MSERMRRGASAELYFPSQAEIEEYRATAAKLGLSLSAYVRQLLKKAQEEGTT